MFKYFLHIVVFFIVLALVGCGKALPAEKKDENLSMAANSTELQGKKQLQTLAVRASESLEIYRSGQPDRNEFKILADYGFKSVLNLRNNNSDAKLIGNNNLREFRLRTNAGTLTEAELVSA